MAKQTTLEEVRASMKDMLGTKSADLYTIAKMQQETRTKIEAAELAMKKATEVMDVDAYEEARQAKYKAQTALDMYNGRYEQIKTREYISEEESDKVIRSLLDYEKTLAEGFKFAAAEPLKKLADLYHSYKKEVAETERTLTDWQRDIHANYLSEVTLYVDPVTGQKTHRSPRPILVRQTPYYGCDESKDLGEYLKKAEWLYSGD